MANFKFKIQAGKKYTYVTTGLEMQFLLMKILDDKKHPVALEDVVITLEKTAREPEQQWWDVEH